MLMRPIEAETCFSPLNFGTVNKEEKRIMDRLTMKAVTPIDLVDNVLAAQSITCQAAPISEGAFRKVWLGNYQVLKEAKAIPDGNHSRSMGNGEANRLEAEIWNKHKDLDILAEIKWKSACNKYLTMELLDMDRPTKDQQIQNLFHDLWVDENSENESAIKCMERMRLVTWALVVSNFDGKQATQRMKLNNWDGKVDPRKVDFDREIYQKIFQLPPKTIWDLHYSNWGYSNFRKQLLILDYAGI